ARVASPGKIRVANWWTGKMATDESTERTAPARDRQRRVVNQPAATPASPRVPAQHRAPAADQLRSARERVAARRDSARARIGRARPHGKPEEKGLGTAVGVVLLFMFIAVAIGVGGAVYKDERNAARAEAAATDAMDRVEAQLELLAEADLEEQLAETERQIRDALADAGSAAQSGLESALEAIREARIAIGLRAPDAVNAPATPDTPGATFFEPARAPLAEHPVVPGGSLTKPGTRIAFLSDFRPPLDPILRSQADGVIGLLEGAGADVFGEMTPRPEDPREAGREIATVAELRRARASTPLGTREAADRLRAAVTTNDEFDAVLWIAPDPTDDDRVQLFIATATRSSLVKADALHPGLLARYALPNPN
ncbi:MAG: hypothetical protein AAF297_06790, partial [Planctomycetota bacterium]